MKTLAIFALILPWAVLLCAGCSNSDDGYQDVMYDPGKVQKAAPTTKPKTKMKGG